MCRLQAVAGRSQRFKRPGLEARPALYLPRRTFGMGINTSGTCIGVYHRIWNKLPWLLIFAGGFWMATVWSGKWHNDDQVGFYLYEPQAAPVSCAEAGVQIDLFSTKQWRGFPLVDVKNVTEDTKHLTFKLPYPDDIINLPVASCITCRVPGHSDKDGKPVIRPYTPINQHDPGKIHLSVKVYPDHEPSLSQAIHKMKIGDILEFKGPWSKVKYSANMKKRIGMVCGGTGIAPMLQVIHEICGNTHDNTQVDLLFCNKTEKDIIFKEHLDTLAANHPNFNVTYCIDQSSDAFVAATEGYSGKKEGYSYKNGKCGIGYYSNTFPNSPNWTGPQGYVTADMITEYMPPPGEDNMVFVCGNNPMLKSIAGSLGKNYSQGPVGGILKKLGYKKEMVYKF